MSGGLIRVALVDDQAMVRAGFRMILESETDITVVGECSRATLLRVFPRVYKGTHVDHPVVTVMRAASVELVAEDVTGYADGEYVGPLPLTAHCVPGAVRVVGP